ncbi:hypothetical protein JXL19_09380 [bacterium]|nr:hypothetical protein [bacterium]
MDSCLLLKEVYSLFGDRVHTVTFASPLQTKKHILDAKTWAEGLNVRHLIIDYSPLKTDGICNNSLRRCYLCKSLMFYIARGLADKIGKDTILIDGSHLGDDPLLRPGMKANKEFCIFSPWMEIGLGKIEIRDMARDLGLSIWDKPLDSCLATRFPFGYRLSENDLNNLESAESALRGLGLMDFRFRPADSPPLLLLSAADHSIALDLGMDKIRETIVKETGCKMDDGVSFKIK